MNFHNIMVISCYDELTGEDEIPRINFFKYWVTYFNNNVILL